MSQSITADTGAQTLWFTRCPVPTATGLAWRLGWLEEEFSADGIRVATLQDAPPELARHHYDHALGNLIREGGALLALAARAQGASTKVIGLTWIDEWQVILARPDSGIQSPADLKGKRLALPAFVTRAIAAHARGSSIARGMSLQGYKGALAAAGLTLEDARFVEVASGDDGRNSGRRGGHNLWQGLEALRENRVDAVYVKGARAVTAAKAAGAVVAIDLDALPEKRFRVNNGTPRPITVHTDFIEHYFDLLVRFLAQTLKAADWAATHLAEVRAALRAETGADAEGVAEAYRQDFHRALHPDLSRERRALLAVQKNFMWLHGFLDQDFDLESWFDERPLAMARALLEERDRGRKQYA
ncbi:MAG: ABC transporter substrate-binding protein [Zoogloeaceae bacterium]|jgi:ABC-type nitrate/sulfonate/bicarbonate transport system substrate-binding protein|nr:ABC transporter substrate-binding protein [Zoogloeaceae bacterium]